MPPESTITFAPEIDERQLDRETSQVNDELQTVGEDVPVNFDSEGMDGLGGAGSEGLDGVPGGGGGSATGAGAAAGIASRIPKSVAGVTAAAAVPVALSGAVGLGMLSAMHGASARLQTSTTLLGQAWNNIWRPLGDRVDDLFIRDVALDLLQETQDFAEAIRRGEFVSGTLNLAGDLLGGVGGFRLDLQESVTQLTWSSFISVLDWGKQIKSFSWADYISDLTWGDWLNAMDWVKFINPFQWSTVISKFLWSEYLQHLSWNNFVSSLTWNNFVNSLDWLSLINPFHWSTVISEFIWDNWIDEVSWGSYIPHIDWSDFIPDLGGGGGGGDGDTDMPWVHSTGTTAQGDSLSRSEITNPQFRQDMDTTAVEDELRNIKQEVNRLRGAMQVSVEVDGEQIAQANAEATQHKMADTDPTV